MCLSCMLGLAWRLADGWVSPLNLYLYSDQALAAQARIDEAARSLGRAPSAVRRIYTVVGSTGTDTPGHGGLHGAVDVWARILGGWATELGLDTFIFWPRTTSPEQVRRFAVEVVQLTRELVEQTRQATLGS